MEQSWKNFKAGILIGLMVAVVYLVKGVRTIARLRSHGFLLLRKTKSESRY